MKSKITSFFTLVLTVIACFSLLSIQSSAAGALISSVTVAQNWGRTVSVTINADTAAKQFGYTFLEGEQPTEWFDSNTFEMNTNGNYIAWAKTADGSIVDNYPFNVSKVDNINPTVSDVIFSNSWTPLLAVTINSFDMEPSSGIEGYSISDNPNEPSEWQTSQVITLRKNGVYYAWVRDNVGNVSLQPKQFIVSNIDSTAPSKPTFSKDPSSIWSTNPEVTVTITAGTDSESGIKTTEYRLEGGDEWITYTSPIKVTENTVVYSRTIDNANNVSLNSEQIRIDTKVDKAPSISFDTSYEWSNKAVTVTIVPGEDVLSGVANTMVSLNGSVPQLYEKPFIVSETTTIIAITTDVAGNSIQSSRICKVDMDIPSFPLLSKTPESVWANTDVTITVIAGTDNNSGIKQTDYCFDDGAWIPTTGNEQNITVSESCVLSARSVDNAGNVNTSEITVQIDRQPPTATIINKSITDEWATNDLVVSVDFGKDTASGVVKREYKIGNNEWLPYEDAITFCEDIETTFFARTIDAAGNSTSADTFIKVDKTSPTLPSVSKKYDVEWSDKDNVVTITPGKDVLSGISVTEYKLGGHQWTKYLDAFTVSDAQSLVVRTYDVAGNYSEITTTINVDKDKPTQPILEKEPNGTWTNGNVSLSITPGNDITSGVKITEYRINAWTHQTEGEENGVPIYVYNEDGSPAHEETQGTWLQYTGLLTISSSCRVEARSTDYAGNYNTDDIEIRIDTVNPPTPVMCQTTE